MFGAIIEQRTRGFRKVDALFEQNVSPWARRDDQTTLDRVGFECPSLTLGNRVRSHTRGNGVAETALAG
jgi:hypothetical protein